MSSPFWTDTKKHLNLFSLYLLYCSAFLYFNNPSLGEPALKLFLITSLISILWHLPTLWRNPIFFLLIASIMIQIASWFYAKNFFPEYAEPDPDLKRLGHLFLFIPIAWILQANNRSPWMLMTVFFVGICITAFTRGDGLAEFSQGRPALGLRNAQHPAMMFAISLVILLAFRKRALQFYDSSNGKIILALSAGIVYCIYIIGITNTRGVLLGLLASLLIVGASQILKKNAKLKKRKIVNTLILVMAVTASLSITSNPFKKWFSEVETVKSLASGEPEHIPKTTSSGIRIHTWIEGWHWFLKSPWVGWGENGKKLAIKESSSLPDNIRERFGHLHNSYVETLVNNGIIGLTLLLLLHGWLATAILRSCQTNRLKDVHLCTIAAGTLWLTANFFESYMFYETGVMIFGVGSAALLNASGYKFGKQPTPATEEM